MSITEVSIQTQDENADAKDENAEDEKIPFALPKNHRLPEKTFKIRNSVLIELFDTNPSVRSIYHIFIGTFLCLFVNSIIQDCLQYGEIRSGFRLVYFNFNKIHLVMAIWTGFFILTCSTYFCFKLWARVRVNYFTNAITTTIWDCMWILLALGYYFISFYLAAFGKKCFQLEPASALIVHLEMVRLIMKIHAFIRTKVPEILHPVILESEPVEVLVFQKFLYFLFAPTLIYRDEYPRTKKIRWSFILYRILEVIATILYYSFIFELVIPTYREFGIRKYTWGEVLVSLVKHTMPGMLITASTFFIILHSFQNAFAELLRFGDRMFYKDWWTSTNFSEFFRKWNVVVGDWLFTYVYKDMYEIVIPHNRSVAKFTVFLLSALVHEWVVTYSLEHFFPVMFTYFILGLFLSCIVPPKIPLMNILFLYAFSFGAGNMLSLYFLEYYAIVNAPVQIVEFKDYLLPRWLNCNCIS